MRKPIAAAAALVLLVGMTACAGPSPRPGSTTDSTTSDASRSSDADWLARGNCRAVTSAPSDDGAAGPVLTVRGVGGGDGGIAVTMAQLDALPQVECTVDDRQAEGRTATFRGALLADVVRSVGVPSGDLQPGDVLHTAAVNDYSVDLPVSDTIDYPVLLATRLDGRPMTVAHYGPLRVVYPTTGFDLDPTVYDPRWIWQLTEISL
ncbi:molybdopterin-dependent oxidoreductase [Nakamurella sp.]|uniref:molybdopterin-dependent oxidoreductase n=1 Tax=Nakamurella sp. TaxID=1869182 RepID=UPI003B3B462B